jgi:hypothetical protein
MACGKTIRDSFDDLPTEMRLYVFSLPCLITDHCLGTALEAKQLVFQTTYDGLFAAKMKIFINT